MSNKIEDQINEDQAEHNDARKGENYVYDAHDDYEERFDVEDEQVEDEQKKAHKTTQTEVDEGESETDEDKSVKDSEKPKTFFGSAFKSEKLKNFSGGFSNTSLRLKAFYKAKPRYFLIGGLIVAVVAAGVIIMSVPGGGHSNVKAKAEKNTNVAAQMQQQSIAASQEQQNAALQKQLAAMQRELERSTKAQEKLSQLQGQIGQLTQAVQGVQQSADQAKDAAQQSIEASETSAKVGQAQVAQVQSQIEAIHKQLSPDNYLPVTDLPFEVVGSGYWGNDLMVTIAIKDVNGGYHYRLMGVGQQFNCTSFQWKVPDCATWNLKSIAGDPAQVIFVNASDLTKKVKAEL